MGVDESTLIAVAPVGPVDRGTVPPDRPTIAAQLYRLISERPYELTSKDVLWAVHADRDGIPEADRERPPRVLLRRPCLPARLPARQALRLGVPCDEQARIALVGVKTQEYAALLADDGTKVLPAMRSSR